MQAASRITGWFALAMVVTGCGASDVVSPAARPSWKAIDPVGDVVRAPIDSSFHETERFSIRGTPLAGGGCHFEVRLEVPEHQMRRARIVEVRKSTCDAIVIARNDPYLVALSTGLAPSLARLSLSPIDAHRDFAATDPSTSYESDAAYGSITPTTLGTGFAMTTAINPIGGVYETRDRVTLSYSKANGCIQQAHLQNYAQWAKTRTDAFGWDIDEMAPPDYSGDPCGTWTTHGHSRMVGTNVDPSCGWGFEIYTSFEVYQSMVVANHSNVSWHTEDFRTGSCELTPEFVSGAS